GHGAGRHGPDGREPPAAAGGDRARRRAGPARDRDPAPARAGPGPHPLLHRPLPQSAREGVGPVFHRFGATGARSPLGRQPSGDLAPEGSNLWKTDPTPNTRAKASATAASTSAMGTARPSSRSSDVTPRSAMPHGTISSKCRRSVATLR